MTEQERTSYIELERLMKQQVVLYYGAMKVRITGLDIRRDRMFIGMEEDNGATHDFDKKISDVISFLSRIRLTPTIEDTTKVILVDRDKRKPHNVRDYDIVSVWSDNGVPKTVVFSVGFSQSSFLKKNAKLAFGKQPPPGSAIYMYPNNDKGYTVTNKTKLRLGITCGSFARDIKHATYTMELVMLNGKEALKLLPAL
jgi:hypothetical protein